MCNIKFKLLLSFKNIDIMCQLAILLTSNIIRYIIITKLAYPKLGIINGGNNMIKEINDKNFNEEIVNSDSLVVVDFWAPWCGPCKMLSPVIEELSNEMGEKVKFAKVNVDESPIIASTYKISSIPTVMVFNKESVKETLVGFRPKAELKKVIEKNL